MNHDNKDKTDNLLPSQQQLLIVSLNVAGLKTEVWQWVKQYLASKRPAVLCLSETKTDEPTLKTRFFSEVADSYVALINSHTPRNLHGIAMLIRNDIKFEALPVDLGACPPRSDNTSDDATKGRLLSVCLNNDVYVVAAYVPNSGTDRKNPLKHLKYRTTQWDPALRHYLEMLSAKKPTLWIGDLNVASQPMDVTNAVKMSRWAGFTNEERANLNTMLKTGSSWIDIWRQQHPRMRGYSWYGRTGQNGMRLDSAIVSQLLAPRITDSFILSTSDCPATLTDHRPIGVSISQEGDVGVTTSVK